MSDDERDDFKPGNYTHYKGGTYTAIGLVIHHETRQPMVLYIPHKTGVPTVRPLRSMELNGGVDADAWADRVEYEGRLVPRFANVDVAAAAAILNGATVTISNFKFEPSTPAWPQVPTIAAWSGGEALRKVRMALGKTIIDVAALIHKPTVYVDDIETGCRPPLSPDQTRILAKAFNITIGSVEPVQGRFFLRRALAGGEWLSFGISYVGEQYVTGSDGRVLSRDTWHVLQREHRLIVLPEGARPVGDKATEASVGHTSVCVDDACPLPEHVGPCPENVTLEMWRDAAKRARKLVGTLDRALKHEQAQGAAVLNAIKEAPAPRCVLCRDTGARDYFGEPQFCGCVAGRVLFGRTRSR